MNWFIGRSEALSDPERARRKALERLRGLAELDDPAAIPALQTALTAERSERLRAHLRLVLDQLQATNVALRHR